MGWTSVSYTVTRNNAVVQGLIDGKGYFFRIAAENIIGMGPFIETDKMVLIKDPICKSDTQQPEIFLKIHPDPLGCFVESQLLDFLMLVFVSSSRPGASGGPDHHRNYQGLYLCCLETAQVRRWRRGD